MSDGTVLRCTVNDWQEQKLFGGLRKIVTYLVTVTKHAADTSGGGKGGSGSGKAEQFCAPIRRRYSDFDWLFKIISSRYIGTWYAQFGGSCHCISFLSGFWVDPYCTMHRNTRLSIHSIQLEIVVSAQLALGFDSPPV